MGKHTHIVSFSGGAASFATAVDVCKKYGTDNVVLVFCDTLIEDEDLYRFIEEAALKLNVPLIRLCKGETVWEVFKRVRYQGNTRIAHCTTELKGKMFAKWLHKTYKPEDCTIWFGFDWSEAKRLERAQRNWHPYTCKATLTDPPFLSKAQVFQYLDDYDIEIPRLYSMGFTHNNCGGFCVKAGQAHFANLLKQMPERYLEHEASQEQLMLEVPVVKPFLRMTINKELQYLTLKEFRLHLQTGGQFLAGDTQGCNCFSDTDAEGIEDMLDKEVR